MCLPAHLLIHLPVCVIQVFQNQMRPLRRKVSLRLKFSYVSLFSFTFVWFGSIYHHPFGLSTDSDDSDGKTSMIDDSEGKLRVSYVWWINKQFKLVLTKQNIIFNIIYSQKNSPQMYFTNRVSQTGFRSVLSVNYDWPLLPYITDHDIHTFERTPPLPNSVHWI